MCNQSDASTQHKQSVQYAHAQIILSLLGTKGTAVTHQVNEADSDTTIDVKDEVVLLRSGHSLHGDGIIKHLAAGESLVDKLFDEFNAKIGVVTRLDLVANTGDCNG